ncbi:MAG: LytTR family DNA-binding domain-containing protein [Pseudomonadales bacterium]
MTTAILVDDEANLLEYLARKLKLLWPELEILGTASNGREALDLIRVQTPDILFLDIHMPGLSGLDVAAALPPGIRVVFVTAHDEYAVAAFEQAAVDYLLKPVEEDRLAATVRRLQARAAVPALAWEELAGMLGRHARPDAGGSLKWLRATRGEATHLIPVESIVYLRTEHKYTSVVLPTEEHLIRTPLATLEASLDPDQFWRIHRGIIVRVQEILQAQRDLGGRYTLTLRSRPEQIRTSRTYAGLFRSM